MRLTSLAAAILILAAASYSALYSVRANAAATPQGAPRGPMGPPGSQPNTERQETPPPPADQG
jgi:hypothetical protein